MLNASDLRQARIVLGQVIEFIDKASLNERTLYPPSGHPGSQEAEETVLRQLLPLDEPWTYVDVGASHPTECSNTWWCYEGGKRGLLIEPRLETFGPTAIKRPGDYIFPVAAGDYRGVTVLRLAGTCSSIDPLWLIDPTGERVVETWPLREILALFPAVRDSCQLCSIDVEGAEAAVLRGIDWATFTPDVLVIEYVDYNPHVPGRDRTDELMPLMDGKGYKEYWRGKYNMILVQQRRLDKLEAAKPIVALPAGA